MAVLLTVLKQCGLSIHPIAYIGLNLLDDIGLTILATVGVAITIPLWYKVLAAFFIGAETIRFLCLTLMNKR